MLFYQSRAVYTRAKYEHNSFTRTLRVYIIVFVFFWLQKRSPGPTVTTCDPCAFQSNTPYGFFRIFLGGVPRRVFPLSGFFPALYAAIGYDVCLIVICNFRHPKAFTIRGFYCLPYASVNGFVQSGF